MRWLAIPYFVHLVTTVIWLGSLAMMALLAFPAWREQALQDNQWLALQKRLTPWVNGSMALLWITGFVQMTNDAQYAGFMVIDSPWAWAMVAKHVAVIGLTIGGLLMQFRLLPAMERVLLLQGHNSAEKQLKDVKRRETTLLRVNILLAIAVLFFTALATAT